MKEGREEQMREQRKNIRKCYTSTHSISLIYICPNLGFSPFFYEAEVDKVEP